MWRVQPPKQRSPLVDSEQVVQFAEDYLGKHPWFGGAEFSAADIMMKFPLDFGTGLNVVDAKQFPNVAAWKAKIEARPAYQRMRAKALPDGMVGVAAGLAAARAAGSAQRDAAVAVTAERPTPASAPFAPRRRWRARRRARS